MVSGRERKEGVEEEGEREGKREGGREIPFKSTLLPEVPSTSQ